MEAEKKEKWKRDERKVARREVQKAAEKKRRELLEAKREKERLEAAKKIERENAERERERIAAERKGEEPNENEQYVSADIEYYEWAHYLKEQQKDKTSEDLELQKVCVVSFVLIVSY